jgi:hypothetical protein
MSPDTTSLRVCLHVAERSVGVSRILTHSRGLSLFRVQGLVVYEGRLLEEVGSEAGQICLRQHGLHDRIVQIVLVHFRARNRHVPATNTFLKYSFT